MAGARSVRGGVQEGDRPGRAHGGRRPCDHRSFRDHERIEPAAGPHDRRGDRTPDHRSRRAQAGADGRPGRSALGAARLRRLRRARLRRRGAPLLRARTALVGRSASRHCRPRQGARSDDGRGPPGCARSRRGACAAGRSLVHPVLACRQPRVGSLRGADRERSRDLPDRERLRVRSDGSCARGGRAADGCGGRAR